MRVAMVADCYHPVINGVVTSVSCLVQALESQGYDGWYVMEQDQVLQADPGVNSEGSGPLADVLASVAFLHGAAAT